MYSKQARLATEVSTLKFTKYSFVIYFISIILGGPNRRHLSCKMSLVVISKERQLYYSQAILVNDNKPLGSNFSAALKSLSAFSKSFM